MYYIAMSKYSIEISSSDAVKTVTSACAVAQASGKLSMQECTTLFFALQCVRDTISGNASSDSDDRPSRSDATQSGRSEDLPH